MPYMRLAAPGRGVGCLRCLRDGCGRYRQAADCGYSATSAGGPAKRYPWLLDVVEAEKNYRRVVASARAGAVRAARAGRRRKRVCSVRLPAGAYEFLQLLAEATGRAMAELALEAQRLAEEKGGEAEETRLLGGLLSIAAEELKRRPPRRPS